MRLFGMGGPELVIIVIIILVIFGAPLLKTISKRSKATAKAVKKGLENGAESAGLDVEAIKAENAGKSLSEKIETFQNKVDERMENAEEINFEDDEEK